MAHFRNIYIKWLMIIDGSVFITAGKGTVELIQNIVYPNL